MHRVWIRRLLTAGLLAAVATTTLSHAAVAAPRAAAPAPAKARSKVVTRQFTGIVTAFDKQSITVEKSGKQPVTRTFARHEDMTTTGDLAREARVTVYYREEGGKSVAHRVVVKSASGETAAR